MKRKTILRLCASTFAATLLGVAPAMAQQVVKIGYSGPLSGGAALYGAMRFIFASSTSSSPRY